MKFVLIAISLIFLIFGQSAFSMEETLDFKDNFQEEKVVIVKEILMNDLVKLHKDFEVGRKVAGKVEKKAKKKSYAEGLRSKLENSKGITRF